MTSTSTSRPASCASTPSASTVGLRCSMSACLDGGATSDSPNSTWGRASTPLAWSVDAWGLRWPTPTPTSVTSTPRSSGFFDNAMVFLFGYGRGLGRKEVAHGFVSGRPEDSSDAYLLLDELWSEKVRERRKASRS